MLIYCAGPIDHASDQNWLDELVAAMKRFEWDDNSPVLYQPAHAFFLFGAGFPLHRRDSKRLIDLNEAALKCADAMVLKYVVGLETWGTPAEVRLATRRKLPIYLHTQYHEGLERVGKSVYLSHAVPADRCFVQWGALISRLQQDFHYPPSE